MKTSKELTPREREIVKLLAEENSVKDIAQKLKLSYKTVDAHKFNLMKKLGIHSTVGLALYAVRTGIIKLEALIGTPASVTLRGGTTIIPGPIQLRGTSSFAASNHRTRSDPMTDPEKQSADRVLVVVWHRPAFKQQDIQRLLQVLKDKLPERTIISIAGFVPERPLQLVSVKQPPEFTDEELMEMLPDEVRMHPEDKE